jgi:3-methyladenine DNA glycosylase Mpg
LQAVHSGGSVFDRASPLFLREGKPPRRIEVSPRVGITQAADWPLRFYDADSRAVSAGARRRAG